MDVGSYSGVAALFSGPSPGSFLNPSISIARNGSKWRPRVMFKSADDKCRRAERLVPCSGRYFRNASRSASSGASLWRLRVRSTSNMEVLNGLDRR